MHADTLSTCIGDPTLDFADVLSVLVKNAGINPNEPYVIDDLKTRLRIRTNTLTHLLALLKGSESSKCHTKV